MFPLRMLLLCRGEINPTQLHRFGWVALYIYIYIFFFSLLSFHCVNKSHLSTVRGDLKRDFNKGRKKERERKKERKKERTFPFLRPFNSNQIDFKKCRHFSYLNKFNSRERKKESKEKNPIPLWSLIRGDIISAVSTRVSVVSVHSALWNAK